MTPPTVHALPRSLDQISGLRVGRLIRESTTGQWDNFGPDAQRELQDRIIERYGLVDTGLLWQSAESGRTVYGSPQYAEMFAASKAGKLDLVLVGYVSRFSRNLKQTLIAVDELHALGVALVFCDERIVSSTPGAGTNGSARLRRPSPTAASSAAGSRRAWPPSAVASASPVASPPTATSAPASRRSWSRCRPSWSGSGRCSQLRPRG